MPQPTDASIIKGLAPGAAVTLPDGRAGTVQSNTTDKSGFTVVRIQAN